MVSSGHLLRPFQGHVLQDVAIHLGIDEGSAEMAMTEHVRNCLQGMTLMEHSGGEAMPKGMCPLAAKLDACSLDATLPDSRKRARIRQWMIGRPAGQKYLRGGRRGTGVLQVIQ